MKWEYLSSKDEKALSEFGEQGWELVSIIEQENDLKFYLKRPVKSLKEQITDEQRRIVYKEFGLEGQR
jgi:hypothetical protein